MGSGAAKRREGVTGRCWHRGVKVVLGLGPAGICGQDCESCEGYIPWYWEQLSVVKHRSWGCLCMGSKNCTSNGFVVRNAEAMKATYHSIWSSKVW